MFFNQKWPSVTFRNIKVQKCSKNQCLVWFIIAFQWFSMIFFIGFRGSWLLDIQSFDFQSLNLTRFSYYLWFVVPQRLTILRFAPAACFTCCLSSGSELVGSIVETWNIISRLLNVVYSDCSPSDPLKFNPPVNL